jgi:hypothetical protein
LHASPSASLMRARAVSAPGDQRQNVGGHLPQLALDRILAAGFYGPPNINVGYVDAR